MASSVIDPATRYTELIAEHVGGATEEPIDPTSLEFAKKLVLDSVGNAIAGTATAAGQRLMQYARSSLGSSTEASVVLLGDRRAAKDAAFVNSQLAALLDFDETFHNAGHPGSPIVFAALATAERERASGSTMLRAIVTAYDVTARLIDAMRPTPERWARGLFPFSCADAFGPALAAAVVLGLDATGVRAVLGLAGGVARLPMGQKQKQPPKGDIKCGQGWHAEHGIIAADLARLGFTGVADVLDGDGAFWAAAGSDRWNPDTITDGLGERSLISEITFKAQPACRLVHSPLEAVLAAVAENGVSTGDIERIDIFSLTRLSATAIHCDPNPPDMGSAQFSVPFTVALALLNVEPGPSWYDAATLRRADVHALASKVRVLADPSGEADELYEGDVLHIMARVRVVTKYGEFSARVDSPKGDPRTPFTDDEFRSRFHSMVRGQISPSTAEQVIASIYSLDASADTASLGLAMRAVDEERRDQSSWTDQSISQLRSEHE